jgi:intracellular sulfur oxidation DsrE/DsrF family protein
MRTVANCLNIAQAQGIQILLDANGIKSFIPDENVAILAPYLFATRSGVRVQVCDEDEPLATRIISDASEKG